MPYVSSIRIYRELRQFEIPIASTLFACKLHLFYCSRAKTQDAVVVLQTIEFGTLAQNILYFPPLMGIY